MNILLTAYSYIAALVGAGFASGQEILSFFVVHGKFGIVGIALASIIFGYYAYFILESCRIFNANDYNTLLEKAFNKKLKNFSYIITFIFTCVVYCVMIACTGEMTLLLLDLNPIYGSVAMSVLCGIILLTGSNTALKINGILGFIIVIGIISCSLYMLRYREHQTFLPLVRSAVSGAGYSGYNLLGAGIVLAGMSQNIKNRRESAITGLISSCAVFTMMVLVWAILSIYYKYINLGEIPMLTMAIRQNKTITAIYSIILAVSVFTTALSSGFGILDMAGNAIDRKKGVAFITAGGICISQIGFSSLINTVYRICGYIGIVILILMFFSIMRKTKKNLKF